MKDSQCNMIYNYMMENGSITSLDAVREFGCLRLSARIKDLREMGINIISDRETSKNRYGRSVSYARYSLVKKESEVVS